jgi:hypothetical protein
MGEFGASAHCIGERVMHRVSTQPKPRLRSFDFRLQYLLNFSYVLKIGTRFVHRGLSFGNWRTIDYLAAAKLYAKTLGSIGVTCCKMDSASIRDWRAARWFSLARSRAFASVSIRSRPSCSAAIFLGVCFAV